VTAPTTPKVYIGSRNAAVKIDARTSLAQAWIGYRPGTRTGKRQYQ
jgi:hypothetical protein